MKTGGRFEQLVKKEDFTSCMISVIFDEAHCISTWGEFQPEYKEVGCLCYILPKNIPIMIMSATLPPLVFILSSWESFMCDIRSWSNQIDKIMIFEATQYMCYWNNTKQCEYLLSIDSLLSLVTMAELVDKHFVPGPTEWLKKIELRTFNKLMYRLD